MRQLSEKQGFWIDVAAILAIAFALALGAATHAPDEPFARAASQPRTR